MMTFNQPRDFRWNQAALLAWDQAVAVSPAAPARAESKPPMPEPPGLGDDEQAERFHPAPQPTSRGLVSRGTDLIRQMIQFAEIERRRRENDQS